MSASWKILNRVAKILRTITPWTARTRAPEQPVHSSETATGVTYEEARESIRRKFEPKWNHGTFCLDDRYIVENDEFWVFAVGAREFLVDDDHSYAIIGGGPVVFKEDGRVGSRASVAVAMDPTIRSRPNPSPTLKI